MGEQSRYGECERREHGVQQGEGQYIVVAGPLRWVNGHTMMGSAFLVSGAATKRLSWREQHGFQCSDGEPVRNDRSAVIERGGGGDVGVRLKCEKQAATNEHGGGGNNVPAGKELLHAARAVPHAPVEPTGGELLDSGH